MSWVGPIRFSRIWISPAPWAGSPPSTPSCSPLPAKPGTALKNVKEQLRAVPANGIGFGLLRYLGGEAWCERLASLPQADVLFNYLGQTDAALAGSDLFRPAPESGGPVFDASGKREYALEVNCMVSGGRLQMNWTYCRALFDLDTVAGLAHGYRDQLLELIEHCLALDTVAYTPSDFPLAALTSGELDTLVAQYENIANIYRLSPMQQGMLFHLVTEPESGAYFNHLACHLTEVEETAFRRAWETVVARHTMLRTSFHWQDLTEMNQVVHERVELPWLIEDWRHLDEDQANQQWQQFMAADHKRGVALDRAPLMRFSLIRLHDGYQFLWSYSHLLVDGWSMPIIFGELFACYAAYRNGQQPNLTTPRPYSAYIQWLQQRQPGQAEAYWRETLAGFTAPYNFARDDLPPLAIAAAGKPPHSCPRPFPRPCRSLPAHCTSPPIP